MAPESPTLVLPVAVSRKGKERQAPQPTDIADRVVALQRKQARECVHVSAPSPPRLTNPANRLNRPKDRPDRPTGSAATSRSAAARAPSPRRMLASNPNIVVSHPSADPIPDAQEFSRLNISPGSPRTSRTHNGAPGSSSKHLFNPNAEPLRRQILIAEPEPMSDGDSSSYAPRAPPIQPRHHVSPQSRGEAPRLFDHRKDDPTKFGAQVRTIQPSGSPNLNGRPTPTPKSSGDCVSASSTSSASYAHSSVSSNFTLGSTTTDSSQSSAIFDSQRRSEDSAGPVNALSFKLKRLYRTISGLEEKVTKADEEDRNRNGHSRVLMKNRQPNASPNQDIQVTDEEAERERWKALIADHKELADQMHHMLTLTSAPTVPSSLRSVPTKYNLIVRLWTHAFHRILENLRCASLTSVVALEHLQDFIYYAYSFYGYLFEERNLAAFRNEWLEALGDLSRYRILVSKMVDGSAPPTSSLTASAVARFQGISHLTPRPSTPVAGEMSALSEKAVSPTPAARIDDSPPPSLAPNHHLHNVPSVGVVAARLMELEAEPERWRQIAKLWYAKGLAGVPGQGKLHHHLGLLSKEKEGNNEELRGIYHFFKGMTCVHPFSNSRESVLPFWSMQAQIRRQAADSRPSELFIMLHGMLFTNIQLDDFKPILARFDEKLLLDGGESIQDREWIMMAIVNLGAILEYGRPNAVLRSVSGIEGGRLGPGMGPQISNPAMAQRVKLMVAKRLDGDDKKMDVDGEGSDLALPSGGSVSSDTTLPAAASGGPSLPVQLKLALQLTFAMLSHTFRKPTRQTSPFATHMLNPYITIIFTFLATILKDRHALAVVERDIPWEQIAAFLNAHMSRRLIAREREKERNDSGMLLTTGCGPLSEDWCMRGLGWGGKKVYERGFWGKEATGGEENMEMEVLDREEGESEMMDGVIEDGDGDDNKTQLPGQAEMHARAVRVARAALKIAKAVPGFVFVPPASPEQRGEWRVEGVLAHKVARWREEDRREQEEEQRRARGTRWDDDSMEVDDEEAMDEDGEQDDSAGSEDGEQDSDEVKALKARRRHLQHLLQSSQMPTPSRRRLRGIAPQKQPEPSRLSLRVIPGYTILVVDTNILLSSLSIFSSLVESLKWTIVIPLPVIMELDGLASNDSPLGQAASAATAYIVSHLRTHNKSLKVQTSKGNYLMNLSVRTEQVEWNNEEASWERNVDDLILRAAVWQTEHWIDRSTFLSSPERETTGASKVTLLSFDRMLRLKARSRDVDAANEQDLAAILASVS
ncbi:hypothetical protein EUX98_g312 [Antrodiella citrinella]|uniref:PIN domain-containing protein n=1 Tax=Antrodiella citrinella TaxID=2447956 RepID=A0A4V3XJQ4_9APHY|nr:hypothetical protein EUX98_g312 [Antrodiella citrinella]